MASDLRRLFDEAESSDLTICCGDQRYKCHRAILSEKSEYFRALLSPGGQWAESNQSIVELIEDQPVAIKAVLRYIYGFDYESVVTAALQENEGLGSTRLHLSIQSTAQKYMMQGLQSNAFAAVAEEIERAKTARYSVEGERAMVFELLKGLQTSDQTSSRFREDVNQLLRRHFAAMEHLRRFGEWADIRMSDL